VSRHYTDVLTPYCGNGDGLHAEDEQPAVGPVLTRLSDVPREPIHWLWKYRIARRKLNLLFGDPGCGKSVVTVDMAARITTGSPWPDGAENGPPATAMFLTAEDDPADTIGPRADAAGADTSRIVILEAVRAQGEGGQVRERSVTLDDVNHVRDALDLNPETAAIFIDPVSAYLGGADGHRNDEIRGKLAPWAKLAADYDTAIVMVTHMSKGGGAGAMYRAMGSLAFVAAARSAWLVVKDKEDSRRRLFLPAKNNLGNDESGLAYTLRDAMGAPVVDWERDKVNVSANDALADASGDRRNGPEPEEREAAADWLRDVLAAGPVEVQRIKADAKDAGVKWRTLERAKVSLKVRSHKDQFSGAWVWRLPR
jgi:hypothetical protein